MTQKGGFALDPEDMSAADKRRIHAQVDDLLSNPALSDDASLEAIDALVNEVLPSPEPPAPPMDLPAPPPLEDWALDHRPARQPGADGGGGRAESGFPSPPPVNAPDEPDEASEAATPDWEDRFALWHPPQPEPINVPDDVADITPVADPAPPQAPDMAATEGLTTSPAPQSPFSSTPSRSLAGVWAAMPAWLRIAAPTFLILLVIIVVVIALTGRRDAGTTLDAPPPEAVPPETSAPLVDDILHPQLVKGYCAAPNSDASLAFGTDDSQAWECTRLFNVDHAVLEAGFNQPVVVSKICVMPGFKFIEPNGRDHWNEHRLVTRILWRIGGTQITQNIIPTREPACMTVANIAAQTISGTIQATERPPAVHEGGPLPGVLSGPDSQKVDETFALGHISIYGHPAGGK